ncbi:hypothetical protein ACROYT_G028446 [Oculina patagonica]
MRFAKDSRGMARFKPAEWRTAKQISSLFSRLAAKQRKKPSDQAKESDEEGQTDNDEDAEDWEREEALALGGKTYVTCKEGANFIPKLPVISPLTINGSYTEGSSVNISCAATGKPDPEVSWMRNGRIKSSGKKITFLDFDRIERTDDGLYTCRANNSAGTKTHKGILVVRYPAKIVKATLSAATSWIGQTVTLKCVSDGVPTPTLTWYKPDGNELNTFTAKESSVEVTLDDEQDFGEYKCVTYNGLDPLNDASMLLRQIKKPGSPAIISSASDIQATSLTVKWTAPADDGGSPITAYRVFILKGSTEINNENVTDPGTTSLSVGGLDRDTEYSVKVFARNAVFEGTAAQKTIRTKIEGIPETPDIVNMPAEVQSDEVALKWTKPVSNGNTF